jgi:uncharacterized protein
MNEMINQQNQKILLTIARQALETSVIYHEQLAIDLKEFDPVLREEGASFVTLHKHSQLRGCIGTLSAYQPLVLDVAEHAIAAGTQDYRFVPVKPEELDALHFEISVLSAPVPLEYQDDQDLLAKLQPGLHGVVLESGKRRATFLPQVWQTIPDKEDFLNQLCLKMGTPASSWRRQNYDVSLYEVQEFAEPKNA